MKAKDNPYRVAVGQIWRRIRKDRPNKFKVIDFEKSAEKKEVTFYAVVEYLKGKHLRKINLANFGDYKLSK